MTGPRRTCSESLFHVLLPTANAHRPRPHCINSTQLNSNSEHVQLSHFIVNCSSVNSSTGIHLFRTKRPREFVVSVANQCKVGRCDLTLDVGRDLLQRLWLLGVTGSTSSVQFVRCERNNRRIQCIKAELLTGCEFHYVMPTPPTAIGTRL